MRLLASMFLFGFVALVSAAVADSNTIVAKFDGGQVGLQELKDFQKNGPQQLQNAPFDKIFPALRDQKLVEKIIEREKARSNLANDKEVVSLLKDARKAIEMQVFLKRAIEKYITDDKLRPLYTQLVSKFKGQKEFEVSMIVLPSKDRADAAMKALNSGKSFADVAKEYSVEANTRAQGGRLGFLLAPAIDQVLGADVGKALKILKDNVHSRKIIKKGSRYIIVRRGSSRAATPPSFEAVKPQLKSMYSKAALLDYLRDLTNRLNVKVFTMDGKPDAFKLKDPRK